MRPTARQRLAFQVRRRHAMETVARIAAFDGGDREYERDNAGRFAPSFGTGEGSAAVQEVVSGGGVAVYNSGSAAGGLTLTREEDPMGIPNNGADVKVSDATGTVLGYISPNSIDGSGDVTLQDPTGTPVGTDGTPSEGPGSSMSADTALTMLDEADAGTIGSPPDEDAARNLAEPDAVFPTGEYAPDDESVLPVEYDDAAAQADGYRDRSEAINDAIVNGWGPEAWHEAGRERETPPMPNPDTGDTRFRASMSAFTPQPTKEEAKRHEMPGGSYPIANADDLDKAIHAVGRGKADHDAIRRHIIKEADRLKLRSHIPPNWKADGSVKE